MHLVSLMGLGGRAATALRQVRLLAERGHSVLVGCISGSTTEARVREMGLPVYADFQFKRGLKASFLVDCARIAARCSHHNVDVIHAHLSQESWAGCIGACLAPRRPAVIRSRGVVVQVKGHAFNRLMHNELTDHIVVPSRTIYDHLCSLPRFDPNKVSLIPDGVDTTRFSPLVNGAGIRREFNVPLDAPFVVMVARLERVKGHEIFFKALTLLAQRCPGLRAVCACDERTPGAYQRAIQRARELGAGEDILAFTGMRNDVANIIAAGNVVALPSLGSEGSSRVALEAAACGVPLAASTVGCLPEVIVDGVTGMLVPPGDPDALAAAMLKLLENPVLSRQMGAAARQRAELLYDERLMAERLERVYFEQTGLG